MPDQSIVEFTCADSYKILENIYKYCPLTSALCICLTEITVSRLSAVLYYILALGVEGIHFFFIVQWSSMPTSDLVGTITF